MSFVVYLTSGAFDLVFSKRKATNSPYENRAARDAEVDRASGISRREGKDRGTTTVVKEVIAANRALPGRKDARKGGGILTAHTRGRGAAGGTKVEWGSALLWQFKDVCSFVCLNSRLVEGASGHCTSPRAWLGHSRTGGELGW